MHPPSGLEDLRSLLDAPAPAVLLTYRADGSADVSPVWFRVAGEAFSARYLGPETAETFVAARGAGVIVRLPASAARSWDLSGILPAT